MERIGIQELVEHADRYLERARLGETIEITDGRAAIARLTPAVNDDTALDVMIAQGLVVPASGSLDELLNTPGVRSSAPMQPQARAALRMPGEARAQSRPTRATIGTPGAMPCCSPSG
jgi:antitoxin (DNA-binding transcriptional repressor) of toxin-antitoxin stability system